MKNDSKLFGQIIMVITILVIAVSSCNYSDNEVVLPDNEIVFQTTTLYDHSEANDFKVGFVNSDGSGRTYFTIPKGARWKRDPVFGTKSIVLPLITGDGKTLIFRSLSIPEHSGDLIIYSFGGKAVECGENVDTRLYDTRRPSLINNDAALLLSYYSYDFPLSVYEIKDCGSGIPPEMLLSSSPEGKWIHSGNLSPDGSKIAYSSGEDWGDVPKIFIYDFETGIANFVALGIEPVWSPEGKTIAYISVNGISIMDTEGNSRLLVEYQNPERGGSPATEGDWPPILSWSPDSQWLTYHNCTLPLSEDTLCRNIEDFSMYKVNIVTGEEILITDGGLNPYWKK